MKKIIISLLLIILGVPLWSQPRPVKLSSTFIIDTDCGFDDMRALSLLLARPEITIKAVTTSDGSLSPKEGAQKVLSLLYEFNRSNIPVAYGDKVEGINPAWRPFCSSLIWGNQNGNQVSNAGAADFVLNILNGEKGKTTLICLGSLTNAWKTIKKDRAVLDKIDRIVWYNQSVKPLRGFNYECDRESADSLFRTRVRIDVISSLNTPTAFFDTSLVSVCEQSETMLAGILNNVLSQKPVIESNPKNHFKLSDDLVVLYITNPELFVMNTDMDKIHVRYNKSHNDAGVREAISDMIRGTYVSEDNIVFNRFPIQREMFNYDIRPIIDSVIARYGYDEWKANVMTDEFHGHLGVFSIVGAKMGIKAREIFGVGPDMLEVVTYAGTRPPYSCLTDGIQVSTGATLGMGTIQLATDKEVRPSAVFTFKDRSVRISLKKEYLEKVDSDINEGITKFGLADDAYWKLIRYNALKYWLEWDRNKIFDIEETHLTQ